MWTTFQQPIFALAPKMKATYHLPANFSTPPPPDGPFHLGTVVRAFEKREQMQPLNQCSEDRLPIPRGEIYDDHKDGFKAIRTNMKSGELGIWATALGFDGFGAEASLSGSLSDNDTYTFASVHTQFFYPAPSYISKCMDLPDVRDYLVGSNYKKSIFLVTGLKIARGAAVQLEHGRSVESKTMVGVDNPGGVNVQFGPRVGGELEDASMIGFEDSSDIVVGIQCYEIRHKKGLLSREVTLQHSLYTKGAIFVEDDREQRQGDLDTYQLVSPEEHDWAGAGQDFRSVRDGDMEELWVVPATIQAGDLSM